MKWLKMLWRRITRRYEVQKPQPIVLLGNDCPSDVSIDYGRLWSGFKITNLPAVHMVVQKIYNHRSKYQNVAEVAGIPWEVVACIHALEGGLSFKKCLHNGQPWWKRTTWVPKGLGPWVSWEDAAIDALNRKRKPSSWSLPNTLWFLECYNGLGYRKYHSLVKSPYLWSMTDRYAKGKYASDGKWDENLVSKQVGACGLLHEFEYDINRMPVTV